MTDDIQMPTDVDTSELKEKLASFVDNLTRIDVAREANNDIINDVYTSYDLSLNSKYKVKIFNQTIDRVKNYFR